MAVTYQPRYRLAGNQTWTDYGAAISSTSVTVAGLAGSTNYEFEIIANRSGMLATSNVLASATAGESVEGYTVTTVGPIVYASQTNRQPQINPPWNQFTLTASGVSLNGLSAYVGPTTTLIYHLNTLFQYANGWRYWNTSTSDSTPGTSGWCVFTITGISLNNTTYSLGAVAGSVIATLTVSMTANAAGDSFPGNFGGIYTISGVDAASFTITGNTLTVAAGHTLSNPTYSITIAAAFPYSIGGAVSLNQTFTGS